MTIISLNGIKSTPLASYLKALAVFRILSIQKDRNIRAFWKDSTFCLDTNLSENEIVEFFLNEYSPSPICSPWNGGSGFYDKSPPPGLDALRKSTHPRYNDYREVITTIDTYLNGLCEKHGLKQPVEIKTVKVLENKKKTVMEVMKTDLIEAMRSNLPDSYVPWMNTSVFIDSQGEKHFNLLVGSGGNDGNLEFGCNFMDYLESLIINPNPKKLDTQALLAHSLFGSFTNSLIVKSIGQFDPFLSGGFNQGHGFVNKDIKINPWDYIFIMEGALVHSASIVRRNESDSWGILSIPFGVRQSSYGYTSSAEENSRGELWFPMWENPVTWPELKHLFAEGRSALGSGKSENGSDFIRSIFLLGVDRGISEFRRYSFLERRGKAFIAQDNGVFPVKYRPDVRILDEMQSIVDYFSRNFKSPPASWTSALRRLGEAFFQATVDLSEGAFLDLMRNVGRMERLLARGSDKLKTTFPKPVYGLSPAWVIKCGLQIPEVRLAAAVASIGRSGKVGPIRTNISGVSPSKPWEWAKDSDRNQKCNESTVHDFLGSVLQRRMLDAVRFELNSPPLFSALRLDPSDAVWFMTCGVDTELFMDLLFAFSIIEWSNEKHEAGIYELNTKLRQYAPKMIYPREYCLMKTLYSTDSSLKNIPLDTAPLKLLASSKPDKAFEHAVRRLRTSGFNAYNVDFSISVSPEKLLSTLIIPVTTGKNNRYNLTGKVIKMSKKEDTES
ncbi:type I-U CRISPR-associated protein Csx17 [Myxococcota bacterium]|nr:type I-U CRISPR-associated protein Csx17 [Myxococcota bacterium]MBU1379572.1 type I-U CRISPR-associated protein Csx17 [Myxococcota bacterium]MBU1495795.1 type I-U CRISPR-associated protein Csx17 [Myxococcota bacterium]